MTGKETSLWLLVLCVNSGAIYLLWYIHTENIYVAAILAGFLMTRIQRQVFQLDLK